MIRPTALWYFDDDGNDNGGAYVNKTNDTKADSSITFIDDASDYWYFGLGRRFGGLLFELSTTCTYGAATIEYYNGEWVTVPVTQSYDFTSNGYLAWVVPDDWTVYAFKDDEPHTATPPDTIERFWVRISVASISSAAVISKLRVLPFTTYATADDLSNFLSMGTFSPITTPSLFSIENLLRKAEDRIDFRTKKSWRFNGVEGELTDYNRHGVALRHKDIIEIYEAHIWTGQGWTGLVEGRDQDYFLEPERGMVFFTRLFILPALYAPTGRYSWWWGYGEYKMNVRFKYSWGKDCEKDPQFFEAQELAVKLAAIDLITTADYTSLLVMGTDRVGLGEKVGQWREETDNKLAELESFFLF